MKISILTLFEQLYQPFLSTSLINRAQQSEKISINVESLCNFVDLKERIDRPTCGPSAGMVIAPESISSAIEKQENEYGAGYKIFFSPQGKLLDQRLLIDIVNQMSIQKKDHIILIAGRYEGMDARVEQVYADCIISLGNFVLMGGDLPTMVFIESFLRLVPGVVGNAQSVQQDSYQGPFVDYPEYCLPAEWKGLSVPEIIRSGNHAAIQKWRHDKAVEKTVLHHFEWLRSWHITREDIDHIQQYIPSHYVVLMHSDVLVGSKKEKGTTSVTSLDIHDIARSACTYGLKGFFIVTPLVDQQRIVQQLLDFWKSDKGIDYNPSRHKAVRQVHIYSTLQEVIEHIKNQEQNAPLLIATSAQKSEIIPLITFYDQEKVWSHKQPVALLLGTGRGMSEELLAKADFLLLPVHGFSHYNHLSVRSAAAIIFDRWLGINEKKSDYPLAQ